MPKLPVLGTGISATGYDEAVAVIAAWAAAGRQAYVAICNVHSVMEAHRDPAFAAVLNAAAMATPDGVPLVWALRLLGRRRQGRVYGPDLLDRFAARAARDGGPASYFYGGADGVAARLAGELERRHPGFPVAGAESPPFRDLTPGEDAAAVGRINASGAGVLWVGLGCPKQERWMHAHRESVRPVMIGVGAAFDFHTGRVRQAPRWMMRCGLEWLFRLAVEPRRLWRRYLVNNPHFLWHLAGMALGRKSGPAALPADGRGREE